MTIYNIHETSRKNGYRLDKKHLHLFVFVPPAFLIHCYLPRNVASVERSFNDREWLGVD